MLSRITDFDIRPLNITDIPPELYIFIDECCSQGMQNNSSIQAMKFGRWGTEAWWCTWHKEKIISICGCHDFSVYQPDSWRLMVRTATLPAYRSKAPGNFRKMKNDFNWGFIFPHQVKYAKKQGAKELFFTTNIDVNDSAGTQSSARMNRFVHKILAPAGLCELVESNVEVYYTQQNVWRIINLHLH